MPAHQLTISSEAKRVVFFLGAGASVPFAIPATDRILPIILQTLEQQEGFFNDFPDVVLPGGQRDVPAGQLGSWSDGYVTIPARHFLKGCLVAVFPGLFGDAGPGRDLARQRFTITDLLSIIDYLLLTRSSVAPNIAPLHLAKMRSLLEGAIAITLHARTPRQLASGMRSRGGTGGVITGRTSIVRP